MSFEIPKDISMADLSAAVGAWLEANKLGGVRIGGANRFLWMKNHGPKTPPGILALYENPEDIIDGVANLLRENWEFLQENPDGYMSADGIVDVITDNVMSDAFYERMEAAEDGRTPTGLFSMTAEDVWGPF